MNTAASLPYRAQERATVQELVLAMLPDVERAVGQVLATLPGAAPLPPPVRPGAQATPSWVLGHIFLLLEGAHVALMAAAEANPGHACYAQMRAAGVDFAFAATTAATALVQSRSAEYRSVVMSLGQVRFRAVTTRHYYFDAPPPP